MGYAHCTPNRAMVPVDDHEHAYHEAERRLRTMLFGDGTSFAGVVKGEERRLEATRFLRRMREAFDEVREHGDRERAAAAEARIADLEQELGRLAAKRARRTRKVKSDS